MGNGGGRFRGKRGFSSRVAPRAPECKCREIRAATSL